jgi:biotin operon repressor
MPANETLSLSKQQQIYELGQQTPRLSNREIGAMVGVEKSTAQKYRDLKPEVTEEKKSPIETDIQVALKKQPMSAHELADHLDVRPSEIRNAIGAMKVRGVNIQARADDKYEMHAIFDQGGKVEHEIKERGDGWQVFGATADNHLCNRHERLDVLNKLYDIYAAEGVKDVYNSGNWIDGEARFNKPELKVFGMDAQLEYMIEHYPQRKGITTHYVAGDDHEGWYAQRECINIGRHLELMAQAAGRHDLHYLGYVEHDIALRHGSGEAIMRVKHSGGGSAYALSYTSQKQVESYQGGEKPHIELIGHYHKFDYCYPREVHSVQVGCTEDQTLFMRKKKIQAMVGGCLIWMKQDEKGAIERFRVEWIPFYDLGYYQRRFD